MSSGKRISGIVIIICALIMLLIWEKWAKPKFLYEQIPVINSNMEKGEKLDESKISYIELKCDENHIDKNEIAGYMGKRAKHFIHKGAPLFSEYFGADNELIDIAKGRLAVTLPKSALHSYSKEIRKGDTILVFDGLQIVLKSEVYSTMDDTHGFEIITGINEAAKLSEAISKGRKLLIVRGT